MIALLLVQLIAVAGKVEPVVLGFRPRKSRSIFSARWFNLSGHRYADRTCLLGNNHRDGVGLFRDPNPGAMPGAQLCRQHGIHRERQEARRRRNAVALHDHGAIVQRSAGTKNGRQQVIRQPRVQGDTAFDVGTQANFALDHNQRARLVLGKQVGCEDDVVIGLSFGWGNTTKAEPGA